MPSSLIDRIDQEIGAGRDPYEAVIHSAVLRFRPILMTTLTTIVGLLAADAVRRAVLVRHGQRHHAFGLGVGTVPDPAVRTGALHPAVPCRDTETAAGGGARGSVPDTRLSRVFRMLQVFTDQGGDRFATPVYLNEKGGEHLGCIGYSADRFIRAKTDFG